ncbi:26S protease regulatory subunit 4 [Paragonimus kellicotti]|nr:26S protease regulatory subunit 4 [Paragonimus kellicotti]
MTTNLIETLDPALFRFGRIDRKLNFLRPIKNTKLHTYNAHTSQMTLTKDVNLDESAYLKDEPSGADIRAICT